MRIITLLPLTKRGKQIVKSEGDRWEVIKAQDKVLFSEAAGPWLHVQPITEPRIANDIREARIESASRWIHEFFDENFKVMP